MGGEINHQKPDLQILELSYELFIKFDTKFAKDLHSHNFTINMIKGINQKYWVSVLARLSFEIKSNSAVRLSLIMIKNKSFNEEFYKISFNIDNININI